MRDEKWLRMWDWFDIVTLDRIFVELNGMEWDVGKSGNVDFEMR